MRGNATIADKTTGTDVLREAVDGVGEVVRSESGLDLVLGLRAALAPFPQPVAVTTSSARIVAANPAFRLHVQSVDPTGGDAGELMHLDSVGIRRLVHDSNSLPDGRFTRVDSTRELGIAPVDRDDSTCCHVLVVRSSVASAWEDFRSRFSNLTERELDTLELLLRGLSNRDAGEALGVSVRTIESRRRTVKDKLRLESLEEIATIRTCVSLADSPQLYIGSRERRAVG